MAEGHLGHVDVRREAVSRNPDQATIIGWVFSSTKQLVFSSEYHASLSKFWILLEYIIILVVYIGHLPLSSMRETRKKKPAISAFIEQKEEQRKIQIEHENLLLLRKMSVIMQHRGRLDNWNVYQTKRWDATQGRRPLPSQRTYIMIYVDTIHQRPENPGPQSTKQNEHTFPRLSMRDPDEFHLCWSKLLFHYCRLF